ncbi:1d9a12cf-9efc-43bb-9d82-79574dfb0f22 [Sclerotinia trifoliorum]|uniref:1d9a12cf-9efc-43bb-9d82-79574dfb0f22 n=1 Tax=Sclerotinia trifoliorum TaxID=28548 RepID=A0A8H2VVV0_9HELO|nr:1d9a12cf-9efc-43bb-9d82-79574dfb0f22 [Sclerotinia trifoliorum]
MPSGILKETKTQEKIEVNGSQKVLEPEATSDPELMEPSVYSDESYCREVILSENFLDLLNCDETMGTIETRNHTTINDLPHDVLMIIFDNLTPCMIACLGLTCRRFYTSCKIHHPGDFNLELHDTEQHHSVNQKYYPDTICNPLSCVHYSCDHKRLTTSEPQEDAMLIVEISRHQSGSIPATPYPRRDHLADLIETWHGLRDYRKTWLNVGNNGKSKYILKYLLISVYNPSNEHCKLKSALQDRYSDFYQGKPQRPAVFGLVWIGGPWPTLPNPHQMTPRDWFLKAKEIILGDRSQHMSKDLWAEVWGGYVVGKNCLDWMEERPYDKFSDWSKECLWRRG